MAGLCAAAALFQLERLVSLTRGKTGYLAFWVPDEFEFDPFFRREEPPARRRIDLNLQAIRAEYHEPVSILADGRGEIIAELVAA